MSHTSPRTGNAIRATRLGFAGANSAERFRTSSHRLMANTRKPCVYVVLPEFVHPWIRDAVLGQSKPSTVATIASSIAVRRHVSWLSGTAVPGVAVDVPVSITAAP